VTAAARAHSVALSLRVAALAPSSVAATRRRAVSVSTKSAFAAARRSASATRASCVAWLHA
jgi:hypothetical protein